MRKIKMLIKNIRYLMNNDIEKIVRDAEKSNTASVNLGAIHSEFSYKRPKVKR